MNEECCIGTLGVNQGYLTCSMYVAKKWDRYKEVVPYCTFEAAAYDLKNGKIAAMLVPAAYADICDFIMDDSLIVSDLFLEPIPPLVCVAKHKELNISDVKTVYLHHATKALLHTMRSNEYDMEKIYVSSNYEACNCLVNDNNKYSMSITNKLCADHFGLIIMKDLREEVLMPWICMTRKSR